MKRIIIIAFLILSCNQKPGGLHQPRGTSIGRVNRENITAPQVDYAAEQLRVEVSITNLPKILDRMVSVSLLAEEAVRRGLLKDERVASGLAWVERMFLAQEIIDQITETVQPTLSEVTAYFSKHKDQFTWGLKLNLMVLPDSILAEQTLAEIKSGADFIKLARARSLDTSVITIPGYPTRGIGMSLGWRLADEEAVFELKPGEVSKVLSTPVGYQLVKVVEKKRITDSPSFNEITQLYISEALKTEKRQIVIDSLLNSLREKAKVTLKPESYPRR